MKKILLMSMLVGTIAAQGQQKLIDALYGGKLKTDSGTVIRKGDDLSTKIDTTTKKPQPPTQVRVNPVGTDSTVAGVNVAMDSAVVQQSTEPGAPMVEEKPKDNNAIWKGYIDELTTTLRTEVMTSKKIKGGTYSVLVEYEIGLDGQVTVNNVSSSPANSFLEQQIKERITLTAPQMTPLLNNFGKPRKALKKQMINLAK